ncbi:hypothetical protein [Streptomyces acidicola]|nr:hypothetical protein [Streptomyces acidicola]
MPEGPGGGLDARAVGRLRQLRRRRLLQVERRHGMSAALLVECLVEGS